MASFHLAVKTISRSAGRSATAAAAYRAGVEITDERTGLVHDYTRKQGVEHNALVVPADAPAWANNRAALWNAAEQAETRKNSTVAREYEIALPAELSAEARRELALGLAREISERHGVAVDVVEINPGVVPLAEAWFGFERKKMRRLVVGDGRYFLNRSREQYDAIVMDAFLGDSSPAHLMTVEAFESMRHRLRQGGVLVMNTFGRGLETPGEVEPTALVFDRPDDFYTGSLHARDRFHPLDDVVEQPHHVVAGDVVVGRHRELGSKNAIGTEAEIDIAKTPEALHHQCRSHQQCQGQRYLRGNQHIAATMLLARGGGRATRARKIDSARQHAGV